MFQPDGEKLPDGSDPWALQRKWGGWVREATVLMDGDGAIRHFPYSGAYREQPAFDMDVIGVVRAKWNELRIAEIKNNGGRQESP